MQFPLSIAFKILTLVPQMTVRDATGRQIGHVRRKLLAFREDVTVYADDTQAHAIYFMRADRVIDFNANYHFWDTDGRSLGRMRREGVRSLWRASYVVSVGEEDVFEVREANGFVRLADNLFGQIPFIGMLSGYIFNPKYRITRIGGGDALLMTKRPALLETDFAIEQTGPLAPVEQACVLLGLMMTIMLERGRG